MIIQDEKSIVKMNGALETADFEIKTDDGKMFHILSNLYSNPLGAVVRELSTNCGDGHKIAGSEELPFDIILPGRMDSGNFITFRDYGPGMPHDVVMSIFTTFGQSTKSGSNTETGCLGLGSKSPLAITDSFTVTSVNDGFKTTYSVSKDAQRKPVLAKFGSIETEEENGLSVTVPLSSTHQNNVMNEIISQLEFFKVKPNVYNGDKEINMNWNDNSRFFSLTDEIFIKEKRYDKDSRIIQGEIGYSFNSSTLINTFVIDDKDQHKLEFLEVKDQHISRETFEILNKFFNRHELQIYMPMGTVTFAPSREELIYDILTCHNIMEQLLKSIQLIGHKYKDIYDLVENTYQYRQIRQGYSSSSEYIAGLDDKMKRFMSIIGWGFENSFRTKWKLLDGTDANINIGPIKSFPKFNQFIELRHMTYNPWSFQIQTKNMITKKKDRWSSPDEVTISSGPIYDFVDKVNYKNIKFVLVAKDEKFHKKHINNYLTSVNTGKNGLGDTIDVVMIKTLDIHATDEMQKEFIKYCGLSPENALHYEKVLEISQELIDSGKAPVKAYESKPKTLRYAYLKNVSRDNRNWSTAEVTSKTIKEDLIGLYIPTFNNKIIFKNSTKELYPELWSIVERPRTKEDGLSYLLKFLNTFGHKINFDIKLYSGHENNFKTTQLVHLEDFINAVVAKSRYQNAWHALNRTQKTFNGNITQVDSVSTFVNNIDFYSGIYDGKISDRHKTLLAKIQKEMKPLKDWFFKDEHPIIALYEKCKKYNVRNDYMGILQNTNLINYPEELKIIGGYLDVKFDFVNLDVDFVKVDDMYNLGEFRSSNNFKYGYNQVSDMFTRLENTLYSINKQDFMEEFAPGLNTFGRIPVVIDDEEEQDSAINKHDSTEVELVAE
jgi:hypothetical protein